jgi:hypothetical protein
MLSEKGRCTEGLRRRGWSHRARQDGLTLPSWTLANNVLEREVVLEQGTCEPQLVDSAEHTG